MVATPGYIIRRQLVADSIDVGAAAPLPVSAGGVTALLQLTPTVQAAAYAAGAVVGGLLTFTNAARVSGGSGLIQAASCALASGLVPSLDLVLLSATPSGGTITDRVAVAFAVADLAKVIGVLHMTDTTLLGAAAPSLIQGQAQAMPFKLAATSLFGVLVTRTAVTLTAADTTTPPTITLFALQD